MATDSSAAAPMITGKWSDAEKIALLLSIIRTSNAAPKWSETAVPAGRTIQATQKMYAELIKSSAGVQMVGGADITPSRKIPRASAKKRDANGADGTPSKSGKKRGRKDEVKSDDNVVGDDGEQDGEVIGKRAKLDEAGEDPPEIPV